MTLYQMTKEMHDRLWMAQERWFRLKEQGVTKRALKFEGLRMRRDMFYATRGLIFTGSTRLTYERTLRDFLVYARQMRGKEVNDHIDRKDFRAYMERRFAAGGAAAEMNKVRAAIVKFGALYGKYESFHAMSRKLGARIRELRTSGGLRSPARPHVTAPVREAAWERLRRWDQAAETRTGFPRAYHLVLELQKEAGLRSIEATDRFRAQSLLRLEGEKGRLLVNGKGGREREVQVSRSLYERLRTHLERWPAGTRLSSRKAYQGALRRAILAVGGRACGSHAQRRTSAVELKNERYREHLKRGLRPEGARRLAVEDTIEHLGHSRYRRDLASAYLGS